MNCLDPLTGLRGVAAYSVLIAHGIDSAFLYGGVSIFAPFVSRLAYFGMSLFFVLSGFVIHYNYAESFARESIAMACWRFFVARFARLYPLYAVGVVVSLPHLPAPVFSGSLALPLAYVTLTQSWFNVEMATFVAAWSISTEWFFYAAFVPLVFVVGRLRRPLTVLAVYCVAAPAGLLLLVHVFGAPLTAWVKQWLFVNELVSDDPRGWLLYFAPPVRLLEFVAGMLAAKAYAGKGSVSRGLASVVMAGAAAWCLAVVAFAPLTAGRLSVILPNVVFAPALALFMLCVCRSTGWFRAALSSRALLFMGEISYSVYIWSFSTITLLTASYTSPAWSVDGALNAAIKVALIVGLTTVFAYGSYLLIEAPSRRWLRARLGPAAARHDGGRCATGA